jgi:calcium/calmodulin-dependent protein kinase I
MHSSIGTKCDMWSMGVIVYIILGGYPPFYADTERELFRLTRLGDFEFHEEHWGNISTGAKDLISRLLHTNPTQRASPEEVLASPWIGADRKLLRYNSLADSQKSLKRHIAKQRFKKAIASVVFIKGFAGEHAVFSGKKKNVLNVED